MGQLIVKNKGIKMRIILLSLMMVCLFDYHVNCSSCIREPCLEIESTHCQGSATIRSEFNGTETIHGRMSVDEGETLPKQASRLRYRMPGGRAANVSIEVQGNCCWRFYQRLRYAGDMRTVRGSRTLNPYFAPRSLKVVEC